jgi:hypothetical protein
MTTEREMLEFAAKACGIDYKMSENNPTVFIRHTENFGWIEWNPLTNSADCAAMCAKLAINTRFWIDGQYAKCFDQKYAETQRFEDHNNDREAAWRYAATQVAAKIGGMK